MGCTCKKILRIVLVTVSMAAGRGGVAAEYRSPVAVAVARDNRTLYVADRTAGCVVVLDTISAEPTAEIDLPAKPDDLAASADGKTLYVVQRSTHTVAVVDVARRAVVKRITVGPWPVAVVLDERGGRLYTCNQGDHSVSIVDLNAGREIERVGLVREPSFAALTPDASQLVVANLLPRGARGDPDLAAEVSIVDTRRMKQTATVKLPPGSTVANGVCMSPDGKWAYVVHTLGRFHLPITQLERGWVHTYALTILDVPGATRKATLLLDDLSGGAADPWGVAIDSSGKRLWISHAGIHEVSMVDLARVHELLEGKVPESVAKIRHSARENLWVQIAKDPNAISRLSNDLTALYIAGAIRRVPSGGSGPRGLALSHDGLRLLVCNYYSGNVAVLGATDGQLLASIPLGEQPEADAARRGEIYFHDADRCFQRWHSCATCHPGGRVDGLPWDFLRDGIGNSKDVVSLVLMHRTSPHNRRATRPDPRECLRTGVIGSHLIVPEPGQVDDLLAYVSSLRPEPNPRPPREAEMVGQGKKLFEGKAKCAGCHPPPYFTDRKRHNVGVLTAQEPDGRYDTPSLVEAYRTAPYYHDGRAVTLREALMDHNSQGKHGQTAQLTPEEVDALIAYVGSL